ncbi:MAG TPA: metallophosphoesterase [Polyangiaceae bacterium]|nr:metallophosphoesterase [Polyangiaceae bacterium]
MHRLLPFALFFLIMLTVIGGVHYFIWARLVRDMALPPAWQRTFTTALVVLFLLIPTSFFLRRSGVPFTVPLIWVSMVWMGLLLLLLMALGVGEAARAVFALAQRLASAPPPEPERRVALARLFGLLTLIVTGGLSAVAVRSGLARVALRNVSVRLRRLPQALDGTTIVQLTDVHVGPTIGRAFIEDIVARTNAENPDVVAITGDLVDGSVEDLREHVAPLAGLRARYGVYFVTGNHEYYSGAQEWCEELGRLGIKVLRNERVSIGDAGASFDLAGIDDAAADQYGNGHGADLPRAVAGRDVSRELVLLAHQPKAIFEAVEHGVGLQLSGHTHGGQIWPWTYLVRLQQPVVAGLARFSETQIYVSRGTGYWGPPMRLAAPAEITRVTLRRA